ncbi:MAG TPA: CoA transferase [Candidatus Limnocylindria bacterium]|nr:CoA transferase [Candidatus Limnocylindria bacterium]
MTTRRAPLAGIRVADFTWVWAGPHCTQQLAHLGAEVIRVESATRPCVTRLLPPFAEFKPGLNRSGYFNQYNQGKKSITLDLKQPAAIEVARRLCAASDVVVENFAAGVMDRMGLGWERLHAAKPDLIMISLSGYGAWGPDRDKVSYGPAQVPLSGLSSLTGYRGHPPMHVGVSYGDPTAGLHGAFAVLAALWHRARTGAGQYIDLSQWETSIAVLGDAIIGESIGAPPPARDGNRVPHMAPHGVFRALGEDRWIALAAPDDAAWARLAAVLGRPELATDPRFATLDQRKANEEELEALVTAWTESRAAEDAVAVLQDAGVPAHVAATNRDLAEDPHLEARQAFTRFPHPEVGTRQHIGPPWRMSASPPGVTRPAPCLGADTTDVLRDVCGYAADEIEALRAAGALS